MLQKQAGSFFSIREHVGRMIAADHHRDVVVGITAMREKVHLWSLVLSAVRIDHTVRPGEGGWHFFVAEDQAELARREITLFEEENRNWPPPRDKGYAPIIEREPPVLPVMGVLVVLFFVTGPWKMASPWFVNGALVYEGVVQGGQWWRLVTALTLHADLVHLSGNFFFGGLLAYFLCRRLGSGVAWLLVLLAGIMGNGMNVMLHQGLYRSVGFSTAVFGMVGILSGMRLKRVASWHEVILALGSGAGLLALMGSAGENTDLGAHLWGLFAGFGLGALVVSRYFPAWLFKKARAQWLLFGLSMAIVCGSWWLAFNR